MTSYIMFTSTSGMRTSNGISRSNSTSSKQSDNQSQSEIEEDATSFVILSVIYQGNKLGAAYYNLDRCHLYLMTDHIDTPPSFSLLKLLLRQTEPSHIVTSQQMDENMLHVLREINNFGSATTESTNSAGDRNKLHLLPNIDFALEASKHRLQTLQLLNAPKNMNDFERKIHLSSLIDFTSSCMVKAAGGLLKFLDKNTFGLSLENSSSSVSGISALSLKNILNIDDNSYRALQIFQEERHPSVYKSTVGNKEGLSLYGICNRCKSAIGKKELKRWFLMPTNNPEIIKERQSAIKYFILSKNSDVLSALQGSLKHIKFLPRILTRMKTAQAAMTDWQALYKTSYHAMLICDIARSRTHCLEIFSEISNTFSTDLFRIASLLNKIIDFEEYAKQNHFVVKPGVDSELDKMKRTYNGLPNFMTEVAYQELQELSSDIPQCSVIYLPQLGYLLAIPATEQMKDTKDYSIPNLRFMFITNDVAHYKSDNTKKLDSLLGDTLCDIYDKETQIMHKLQNVILEMKPVLFDVMEYSAKLDWHPLQEICVSSFVGNNVFSGGTESKIKVLTGPNSSGKSIYLKQVALLVYMGHLGSFIPAQKAKIPAFDNIFTCMNASESVSLNLSSFLISLNQVCLLKTIISRFSIFYSLYNRLSLLSIFCKYPHIFPIVFQSLLLLKLNLIYFVNCCNILILNLSYYFLTI
nr:mutS protein homolog 5 isoform X8 [Parasteatoda tepidariorum]